MTVPYFLLNRFKAIGALFVLIFSYFLSLSFNIINKNVGIITIMS